MGLPRRQLLRHLDRGRRLRVRLPLPRSLRDLHVAGPQAPPPLLQPLALLRHRRRAPRPVRARVAHGRAAADRADQHGHALRAVRGLFLRLWCLPPLGLRAREARRSPPVDQHVLPALRPPRAVDHEQALPHGLLHQVVGPARRLHTQDLRLLEVRAGQGRAQRRGVGEDREARLLRAAVAVVLVAARREEGRVRPRRRTAADEWDGLQRLGAPRS
mmetsp:Transcript_5686/g.16460  ORF Transcript_5686/g.16460 Transcript_5686/m.16460 type:complete len:216 (-) Transcript_5686:250-897(-)